MNVELTHHLSVVLAATAFAVAVVHAARDLLRRADLRRRQQRVGNSSRRAGEWTYGSGPAGGGAADKPVDGSEDAGADRLAEVGKQDARTPAGGRGYDPRPQEDTARRRIAYHLIVILAVMLFSLLAMVAAGVIGVDDLEKFGILIAPVATLVSAATSSYYANRRGGKSKGD